MTICENFAKQTWSPPQNSAVQDEEMSAFPHLAHGSLGARKPSHTAEQRPRCWPAEPRHAAPHGQPWTPGFCLWCPQSQMPSPPRLPDTAFSVDSPSPAASPRQSPHRSTLPQPQPHTCAPAGKEAGKVSVHLLPQGESKSRGITRHVFRRGWETRNGDNIHIHRAMMPGHFLPGLLLFSWQISTAYSYDCGLWSSCLKTGKKTAKSRVQEPFKDERCFRWMPGAGVFMLMSASLITVAPFHHQEHQVTFSPLLCTAIWNQSSE